MKPDFVVAYKEVWFVDTKLDVLATKKAVTVEIRILRTP